MGFAVVVHDPFLPDDTGNGVGTTSNAALHAADVLMLHLPLSSQTRGMIGARELALLRPTAGVVNTARGLDLVPERVFDRRKPSAVPWTNVHYTA
jgi:phosphoglycerate dehydrogenase-like enzyme